ncbi:MAG: ABC transporter ATP-binding protein [Gallionella sp.]
MLDVRNLSYRYPHAAHAALSDVSLNIERGQILGLLGPNGAGKTTLISHLSGVLQVQHGDISINGVPLASIRRNTPTRIAVAPQEYAFYPMLTVTENLECFAAAGKLSGNIKHQRIAACLASSQLERFAFIRAERLSGGLKRRLNLAIALLPEPELVLLDEPTVGVDPQSRAFLLDAVKTLAGNGTTVIYTSHYMEEIEAIANRVVIIDEGKVLRDGTLNELLNEDVTLVRFALEKTTAENLSVLLARFGKVEVVGEEWQVTLAPGRTPVALLAEVEQAGGRLRHAEFGHHNLEHLFMNLTHRSLRD